MARPMPSTPATRKPAKPTAGTPNRSGPTPPCVHHDRRSNHDGGDDNREAETIARAIHFTHEIIKIQVHELDLQSVCARLPRRSSWPNREGASARGCQRVVAGMGGAARQRAGTESFERETFDERCRVLDHLEGGDPTLVRLLRLSAMAFTSSSRSAGSFNRWRASRSTTDKTSASDRSPSETFPYTSSISSRSRVSWDTST